METMINLNDLLKHEILDLYSVEEQIIEAMPAMIEKAKNPELKKALREHLKITEEQKSRLDKVKQSFGEGDGMNGESENKGFFSRLFGGGSGGEKCKGMAGIISEGEKIMAADITDEALDAAIIASAQKIEHYEICGYGTARAFARELQLPEVERLLTQTLNEEYQADDLLTALAVGKLNFEAERADGMENGKSARSGRTGGGSKSGSRSSGGSSRSSSKGGSKSSGGKGSSSKGGSSKGGTKSGGGSKGGGSKSSSKGSSSKGGSKSGGGKAGASKSSKSSKGSKGSSKGGSSSGKSGGNKGGNKGGSKKGSSRR